MHTERPGDRHLNTGAGQFGISRSGALAYVPGGIYPVDFASLVWVDRTGASGPLPLPAGHYRSPRFSPDGTRLAYEAGAVGTGEQIWVYDIELETPVRLTTTGENEFPVWSPDGTRLAFTRVTEGQPQLFWMPADGSDEPQRLAESDAQRVAASWSSQDVLAFLQRPGDVGPRDIWTVSMDGDSAPTPFLETPFHEAWPTFSPDGRWLAYVSDETGKLEVYVRPFPAGEPASRVSPAGGTSPLWSLDGQQLFFNSQGRKVMVVDVTAAATFARGRPRVLFDRRRRSRRVLSGPTTSLRMVDVS